MTDFDYKKYSLGKLEEWIHDAISCGEATPQEIYDIIKNVVDENYHIHKFHASRCYELLELLNGNGNFNLSEVLKEREYYEGWDPQKTPLSCDKDDPSPECQKSWNDFWEENYYPEEYALREAEYYNKPDENQQIQIKIDGYSVDGVSHSEYYYDYNRNDPNRKNPFDKVVKWQLPVEVDGLTGECYVLLPDDLLEAANLKEGDQIEWVDLNNGSFQMRKVEE